MDLIKFNTDCSRPVSLAFLLLLSSLTITDSAVLSRTENPGFIVTVFPETDISNAHIKEHIYSDLFNVTSDGVVYTTKKINSLRDVDSLLLNIKYSTENEVMVSEDLNITLSDLPSPRYLQNTYKGYICHNRKPRSIVLGLENLLQELSTFPLDVDVKLVKGHNSIFELIGDEATSRKRFQIGTMETHKETSHHYWTVIQVDPYEERAFINVDVRHCDNNSKSVSKPLVHHTNERKYPRPTRQDTVFVVNSLSEGDLFTIGTMPEVDEEHFALVNTTEPDVLELNTATGMVSLVTGQSLLGVDNISFTVNITRTDNNTYEDFQNVFMKVINRTFEDPIFTNEPYPVQALTRMWIRPGTPILQLQAIDAVDGMEVVYQIQSGGNGRFTVDSKTGEILIVGREPFPCSTLEPYVLAVSAQGLGVPESISTPAQTVTVYCDDINPQFYGHPYTLEINEATPVGDVLISLAAKSFYNLEMRYTLDVLQYTPQPADPQNVFFDIDATTGDLIASKVLDYTVDPHRYVVSVTATEEVSGYSTTQQMVLMLVDINNHIPTFPPVVYPASVLETIVSTYDIVEVFAVDLDTGPAGELTFSTDNNDFVATNTDTQSAVIRLSDTASLDYESLVDKYVEFTLTATDNGVPPFSGTVKVRVIVQNDNDQPPVMDPVSPQVAYMKEAAQSNTLVYVIQAYDPDGDSLQFTFKNSPNDATQWEQFALDQSTGYITLSSTVPDTWNGTVMTVSITDSLNTIEGNIEVQRIGVNRPPRFPGCSGYKPSIPEHSLSGTNVISVAAQDEDSGLYGQFEYSIGNDGGEFFDIDPESGVVTTIADSTGIDRENPSNQAIIVSGEVKYPITVVATDFGSPPLAATCFFLVTINDTNDNAPLFDRANNDPYHTSINPSDVNLGDRIFRVFAYDVDEGDNAVVIYRLTEEGGPTCGECFSINSTNGWIYVNNKDNFPVFGTKYVTAHATDGENDEVSTAVAITFTSVEGQLPPTWLPVVGTNQDIDTYVLTVPDDTALGTVLDDFFQAETADGVTIIYSMPEGPIYPLNADSTFSGAETTDATMKIEVSGDLDFALQSSYVVRLRATKSGQKIPSDARLQIAISDSNDKDPEFIGLDLTDQYPAAIAEDITPEEQPNYYVLTVFAIDRDGTSNNQITYSIQGGNFNCGDNDKFNIDSTTGDITISETFAAFGETQLFLCVRAEDSGGRSSDLQQIYVDVIPSSPDPPIFTQSLYNYSIPSDAPRGTVVANVVADNIESLVQYQIVGGNEFDIFNTNPYSGTIFTVLDVWMAQTLQFSLTYRAFDGQEASETTVLINVEPVNLFPPSFDQVIYNSTSITEEEYTSPVSIATPIIVDEDTGNSLGVSPALEGAFCDPNSFNINPDTFEITVTSSLDRDYPAGYSTWQFNVAADDLCTAEGCDSASRRGYALVNVQLTDINDNDPLFDASYVTGSVPENTGLDTSVMTVFATDFDAGPNADVTYSLIDDSGLFSIDPTSGLISLGNTELDRETQDTYYVVVQAFNPSATERSSTQTMTITVEDENDFQPYFTPTTFTALVAEEGAYGSFVTDIQAYDDDIGENAYRLFNIIQPATNHFYADSIYSAGTASIKILNPIDYDSMGADKTLSFTLTVTHPDPGGVTASATVTVTVTDINDNAPVVNPGSQSGDISENAEWGTPVGMPYSANDIDSGINSQYQFWIDYESSDPHKWFDIEASSGQVTVRNGSTLDREVLAPTYQMTVEILAIDEGTPPQTGTATLTVNLLDVNDNAPYFDDDYDFRVGASTPQGQTVGVVSVTDPDTTGSTLTITIDEASSGQAVDDFEFIPDNAANTITVNALRPDGYIRSVVNLDRYEVYVNLADDALTRQDVFYITVESVNENPHSAAHKDIEVFNYLRSLPETAIGNVYASDEDDWDRCQKTFSFITEYEFFNISDYGELYLIPGAMYGNHNLQITVADDTTHVTSSATIRIIYLDDDALDNVASMRLAGTTVEDLMMRTKVDGGITEYNNNNLTVFKQALAPLLGLSEGNIWIISVRQVPVDANDYKWRFQPDMVDIYYLVHTGNANYNGEGITWFRPASVNGIVWINRDTLQQAFGDGVTILTSPINECAYTNCWNDGCTNELVATTNGLLINTNATTTLGVDVQFKASCTCGARDFTFQESPEICGATSCLNGGTCFEPDTWENIYCMCPDGFEGPRCEQYKVSFDGSGWAWYNPIQSCETEYISIEFMTTSDTGLLLYNGPTETVTADSRVPIDYIFLEVVSGIPVLGINLGSGDVFLEMTQNTVTLNDGRWHLLQVFRNGREVSLVLDACRNAIINEDLEDSSIDTTMCKVAGTLPRDEFLLDVVTPLEVGGRSQHDINYPPNINGQGFNGGIKNVRVNGQLYDLHIGSVGISQGATDNCPQEEASCAVCPINSTCVGSFTGQSSCICDPGVYDEGCSQQGFKSASSTLRTKRQAFFAESTTIRSMPSTESFIQWDLAPSYNDSVNNASNQLQLLFRTRQTDTIIFMASSFSTLERIILEVTNSYLQFRYDLGSGDETVSLPYTNAADGRWHKVLVIRFGNQVSLLMDYGTGRYFNQSEVSGTSFQQLNFEGMLFVGGDVFYPRFHTVPTISSSFFDGCINDVRFSGAHLPMVTGETSTVAELSTTSDTTVDCTSDACTGVVCEEDVLVPEDQWRLCVCTCPEGQAEADPPLVCAPVLDCSIDQCVNGVCIDDAEGNFICYCDEGFSGERCDLGGALYANATAALSLSGLLIIIGSIIILLLLLLFLVIAHFVKRERDTLLEGVEAVDNHRDNIVFYEEEGAGEEDEIRYDISGLRIPTEMISDSDSSRSSAKLLPHDSVVKRTEVYPVSGHDPSGRPSVVTLNGTLPPNIGSFIGERMDDAENDFNIPPWDSVREYEIEGSMGGATDLSSLASSTDSEEYVDYLNDWGPRFSKLAEMYNAHSSTDSDRESSIDTPVKAKPFQPYERPQSPDTETNSEEFRPVASPREIPDTPRYPRDPPAYVNPLPPQHVPKNVHTYSDDSSEEDYENTVLHRPPRSRSTSPEQQQLRDNLYESVPSPPVQQLEPEPKPHHYTDIVDPSYEKVPQPQPDNEHYYEDVPSYPNTNQVPPSSNEMEPNNGDHQNYPPPKRKSSSSSSSSSSSAIKSEIYVPTTTNSTYSNNPPPNVSLHEPAPGMGGYDNFAYTHPDEWSPREGRRSSSLESEV